MLTYCFQSVVLVELCQKVSVTMLSTSAKKLAATISSDLNIHNIIIYILVL